MALPFVVILCNGCGRLYLRTMKVKKLRVVKRDGCTESFDRRKLLAGLHRAENAR